MSLKELLDLGGRKAIVTGGSRGLGLQIAEALGEMGAELVISARKAAELDEAVAHLTPTLLWLQLWLHTRILRKTLGPRGLLASLIFRVRTILWQEACIRMITDLRRGT